MSKFGELAGLGAGNSSGTLSGYVRVGVRVLTFQVYMPDPEVPPSPSSSSDGAPDPKGIWKDIFADSHISVHAAPIAHSVPCVGYVIEERPVPGKMDPKKYLPALQRTYTPMSAMRRLQQGEAITRISRWQGPRAHDTGAHLSRQPGMYKGKYRLRSWHVTADGRCARRTPAKVNFASPACKT